jgi:hypothetical protein
MAGPRLDAMSCPKCDVGHVVDFVLSVMKLFLDLGRYMLWLFGCMACRPWSSMMLFGCYHNRFMAPLLTSGKVTRHDHNKSSNRTKVEIR